MTVVVQGDIQLRLLVLDNIGADWNHDAVQHRFDVRRDGVDGVRVVRCRLFHDVCGDVNGGNLLLVPDFWRSVLLERQTCWAKLGTVCLLVDWLVTV